LVFVLLKPSLWPMPLEDMIVCAGEQELLK